jgi:hypothetical protein
MSSLLRTLKEFAFLDPFGEIERTSPRTDVIRLPGEYVTDVSLRRRVLAMATSAGESPPPSHPVVVLANGLRVVHLSNYYSWKKEGLLPL